MTDQSGKFSKGLFLALPTILDRAVVGKILASFVLSAFQAPFTAEGLSVSSVPL